MSSKKVDTIIKDTYQQLEEDVNMPVNIPLEKAAEYVKEVLKFWQEQHSQATPAQLGKNPENISRRANPMAKTCVENIKRQQRLLQLVNDAIAKKTLSPELIEAAKQPDAIFDTEKFPNVKSVIFTVEDQPIGSAIELAIPAAPEQKAE